MAVRGIYIGLTEPELTKIRNQVLARLEAIRTGKDFASGGGTGGNWSKTGATRTDLLDELAEVNAALRQMNPALYGRRVKKLLADFSGAGV